MPLSESNGTIIAGKRIAETGVANINAILWVWCVFTTLTALIWAGRLRMLLTANRRMPPLHSGMYPGPLPDLPSVSMLLAGKDEERNIQACLESLLQQQYPNLEIIAVNDRSTDATGRMMDAIAAAHPNLHVLHVTKLREGWFGKCNAIREAGERATGEWLCFTDADCVQISPRSIAIAMRYALETGTDFLSVLPMHIARGFWERLLQPACSGLMILWFNPMKVNNPASRAAYANGAFMLIRRSTYEALGGHEAVKSEINEDMKLGRLAKEGGHRLRIVSNDDLYTVRMYESFKEIWNGWTRIYTGSFGTLKRLGVTILVVLFFTLLPWAALITSFAVGDSHEQAWHYMQGVASVTCALQLIVMTGFYSLNRVYWLYGIMYPIAAVFAVCILINAIRRIGGRGPITWKGTTYQGGKVMTASAVEARKD